jgi:hypothetical protein
LKKESLKEEEESFELHGYDGYIAAAGSWGVEWW